MKKTLTINLNGIVFHIDEDAYQLLKSYISDVTLQLGGGDDVAEIIADIEARIAEVFSEKLAARSIQVVDVDLVQEIMDMLGRPSDYSDEEPKAEPISAEKKRKKVRRYYRNSENVVLGGVLSGLSAYLGCDALGLRVVFVVLTLWGWMALVPIYLLVWLIAPVAKTKAQQLEMRGEEVTVDNIKNVFSSEEVKSNGREIRDRASSVIRWIARTCFTIIAILLGFVGLVLLMVFLVVLMAVLLGGSVAIGSLFLMPNIAIWISFLLCILCPIIMLVAYLIKRFRKKRNTTFAFNFSFALIWIISAVVFLFFAITNFDNLKSMFNTSPFQLPHNSTIRWNSKIYRNPNATIRWNSNEDMLTIKNNAEKFNSVDISGDFDVSFSQSDSCRFEIRGVNEDVEGVKYEVVDGELRVWLAEYFEYSDGMSITLAAPELKSIKASGMCNIESEGVVTQDAMHFDLSGASHVDMNVILKSSLHVKASGASKLDFAGSVESLVLDISGASKVSSEDLLAQNAQLDISGASKVDVFAANQLSLDVSGASKVTYKGTPVITRNNVGGMSSVNKR